MSYGVGDLCNWGECLVSVTEIDEDGLYTVEIVECADGSQDGTVTGISEYELDDLTDEDSDLYG